MTAPPDAAILEPQHVADWLDIDVAWILREIAEGGLPVLGYRTDGTPLLAAEEVRQWLRRPRVTDDETGASARWRRRARRSPATPRTRGPRSSAAGDGACATR